MIGDIYVSNVVYLYVDYLQLFRQGDEEGFNYFFTAYYKPLYFFAFSYIKDEDAAEDIVSESFIKLWDRRKKIKIEVEAQLKSYLYKVVSNACLKELRRRTTDHGRQKEIVLLSDKFDKDCFENMIRAETIHLLHKAIEQLPAQCRTVFRKLYVEGKSVADAAGEMGLTVSTIKNQKARGIKLLKPKLQK